MLTESVAIVLYLAEKYPQKNLLPTQSKQRAELNCWLLFTVTELEQPLWRIARHTFLYPEAERLLADTAIARREFQQMAAVLEPRMQTRQFLVGDTVTVGDFVLAYTLDWANEERLLGRMSRTSFRIWSACTPAPAPPCASHRRRRASECDATTL